MAGVDPGQHAAGDVDGIDPLRPEELGGARVHTTKSSVADRAYENDVEALLHLVRPYPAEAMVAYPVAPLLGKAGSGNSERASLPFEYPELILADPLA